MADGDDIAIGDQVLLAFEPEQTSFSERGEAGVVSEVVETGDLSTNEVLFQV